MDPGESESEQQERFYRRLAFSFVFLSPLIFYLILHTDWAYRPPPHLLLIVNVWVFFSGFILGPLVELGSLKLRGRSLPEKWFLIKQPSVRTEGAVAGTVEECVPHIMGRLQELGCSAFWDPATHGITFEKRMQTKTSRSLLDHSLSGLVSLQPVEQGTAVGAHLILRDTLLMDTGEREDMRQVCDYVSLQTAELDLKHLPLLLVSSVVNAILILILVVFFHFVPWNGGLFIAISCFVNLTTMLIALISMLRSPRSIGYRLLLPAGYLAIFPLVGLWIQWNSAH